MLNRIFQRPKKIIFDHLPKCGGTSLGKYLESNYSKIYIYRINGSQPKKSVDSFLRLSSWRRNRIRLIYGHTAGRIITHMKPDYLTITVLREPVDRIVSHYYYVKRKKEHYLHPIVIEQKLDLEGYVKSDLSGELRNWYVQHFSGKDGLEVERDPENSLKLAIDNLTKNYDLIGFLDNYDSFLERLNQLGNFNSPFPIEEENKTLNRPEIKTIPKNIVELIKKINYLDIELYREIKDKYAK